MIAVTIGVYTCSAVNEAARIEENAEIMIETFSPKAPSNLTANSTSDAITIHWTQNTIRPDLKFSIWFRAVDLQGTKLNLIKLRKTNFKPLLIEWRTREVRPSNNYEATIGDLESGKEYEFMVLSRDRYNDGLFSKSYRFRTKSSSFSQM